jgi:hypothetical protein
MTAIRYALFSCASLLLALASPAWPSNGEIGLFFDPSGSKCVQSIPCTGFGKLYVVAMLEGASIEGITGAEYSIRIGPDRGADAGWTFAEDFTEEASVVLGKAFYPTDIDTHQDPFVPGRGVNIAFSECVRGEGGRVLLEEVAVANSACSTDPLPLRVVKHDYFSHRNFLCPLFTLCDAPSFTKVCLGSDLHSCPNLPWVGDATCSTSGGAIINPRPGESAPCPKVAVEPRSWSSMKQLYRD